MSWRGKGSVGLTSRFLDRDRQCFVGLCCWNSASRPASTCSAQDWPSLTLPVSMGADVSGRGVSEAGASTTGVSVLGGSVTGGFSTVVSQAGAVVALALGSL